MDAVVGSAAMPAPSGSHSRARRSWTARLAVEAVVDETHLDALLSVLCSAEPSIAKAFGQLVGALLTKSMAKEAFPIEPWAKLLGMITAPKVAQLGSMRALIGIALDAGPSAEGLRSLGRAARAVFDAMGADEKLVSWLSPHIVPFIARTYGTDVEASRTRLQSILTGERFT
ncbi:MAG: hypothetical protein ACM3W4_12720, partial [Ignavibacteriales bacterium]